MNRFVFHLLPLLLFPGLLSAQAMTDTLLVYDLGTQTLDTIPAIPYDSTVAFDHTGMSTGWNPGFTNLDTIPSTTNLFANSDFTHLALADTTFNLADYPVRTAVKLFAYDNDTLSGQCSGMMVGENLVLTAGHCVFRFWNDEWVGDSLYVIPAYNNGENTSGIPGSAVEKIYLFQKYFNGPGFEDVALLQLEEPVGRGTGWIGVGFSTISLFYMDRVFHKLSYPAEPLPWDTINDYNGDTLYYNYGYMTLLSSVGIGVASSEAQGIVGQSGSSVFYTDNDTTYFSVGVATYSSGYQHYRFRPADFYAMKNVMTNVAMSSPPPPEPPVEMMLYPNPFSDRAILRFSNPEQAEFRLEVLDALGRQVLIQENNRGETFQIDRGNLNSGVYFYRLKKGSQVAGSRKFVIY